MWQNADDECVLGCAQFDKNEQKGPDFLKINPNGRIPALVDHSDNTTVWESKAILLYLVEKYDTSHSISVTDAAEKIETLTYLFFQASGQGPYFGQAAHFKMFAPEKVPYAIKRYEDETKRVLSVLEDILATKPSGWLVGDKVTIADLSFITWNNFGLAALVPEGTDTKALFPKVSAWHEKLLALPYVAEALAEKAAL